MPSGAFGAGVAPAAPQVGIWFSACALTERIVSIVAGSIAKTGPGAPSAKVAVLGSLPTANGESRRPSMLA
jgi:hypothetical protein